MIKCNNTNCKNHRDRNTCALKKAVIGNDAVCTGFEKGFIHYFYYFTKKLRTNFVCLPDVDDDLRYSLYYLMKCMPIEFAVDDNRGLLLVRHSNTHQLLNAQDILEMISRNEIDDAALTAAIADFRENGLPKSEPDPEIEHEDKEFGWISPMGDFIEAPWGEHEEAAQKIVADKNMTAEFKEWKRSEGSLSLLARDFLAEVKGYALVHNPSNFGQYIVSHHKPLTKHQKAFLYGYFHDMGMIRQAEKYIDEE